MPKGLCSKTAWNTALFPTAIIHQVHMQPAEDGFVFIRSTKS